MARIGLAAHSDRPAAVKVAKETVVWLEEHGHVAVVLPELAVPQEKPEGAAQLDLLLSLGGDGTMLRAVGMVLGTGVPVLGVNFGAFGYLAAVEPDGLRPAIERFLAGDFELNRRMTVDASVMSAGGTTPRYRVTGLNDIVLSRPSGTHTISTSVAISGDRFLSYAADSMIVATATGSTGYNLSARGPIVSPTLRCLIITPVSPHMLFDRSLVLDATDEVSFQLEGRCCAELVVDGVPCGQVEMGEQLVCRAGEDDAILVSFGERNFHRVLKNKFHLADR